MMTIENFAYKYGVTTDNVYMQIHNKNPFIKKIEGIYIIDEKAIERRKKFQKKIWLQSHEYYYELIEYFGNDNRFGAFLEKYTDYTRQGWGDFLRSRLFALLPESIFMYKINKRLWEFFWIARAIIRRRDMRIKSIYKRLPNLDNYDQLTIDNALYQFEKGMTK